MYIYNIPYDVGLTGRLNVVLLYTNNGSKKANFDRFLSIKTKVYKAKQQKNNHMQPLDGTKITFKCSPCTTNSS